jgi:hypothetical protein
LSRDVLESHVAFARYHGHGTLPEPGGSLDQTAVCLAAFNVLASCYASIEQRQMDEARRK